MVRLFNFETGPLYCPACSADEIVPAARWEIHDFLLLPLLLLRPFRCNGCRYRFYGFFFRKSVTQSVSKTRPSS